MVQQTSMGVIYKFECTLCFSDNLHGYRGVNGFTRLSLAVSDLTIQRTICEKLSVHK